jgi:Bacteriophage lambda head decoration protein D.
LTRRPQETGSEVYGTDTEQNTDVVASQGSTAAIVEVQAVVEGQTGEIASTETLTSGAWGAATLTGGTGGGIAPVGILTAAVDTGVGESVEVDVFRNGTFNGNALNWHESFNTEAKRERAFEGTISPSLVVKHNPNDPTFAA